jgi:DNA (cytosine-5)-methyltransferase 1
MLKVISLFTGVGGLDFGFEAAGYRTAVALEWDQACRRSIEESRRWPLICDDIHRVEAGEILSAGKLSPGEADVLIGGPPCQPFSKSGYWVTGDAKRLDDPRADTLSAYLRVLEAARPRAFLLENVSGLAYRGKDEGLERILRGIEGINRRAGTNYKPVWQVLSAAAYGVPQLRERVFIVASRDGKPFKFPEPTHGDPADPANTLQPYRTTWDAFGGLPDAPNEAGLQLGGKWADLVPSIPEGQNYLWHTKRGGGMPLFGWRTRYWNFLLKIAKDRPSWTIQAQPGSATGPFHWSNRKLSVRELCRLQTFPDDLAFSASRNEVQRMLGNAVPSLLAEILGREIRRQLLASPARGELRLLPRFRGAPPGAEPVAAVPAKYRHLAQDHADHPGTGKGRGALQRLAKAA